MALAPNATGTIAQALKGIDFPCGRDGLVDYARRRGADPDAVAVLETLPEQNYQSMAEVFHAVGGARSEQRARHAEPPAPVAVPGAPESGRAERTREEEEERGSDLPADPWTWWAGLVTAWGEFNRCLLAQWFPWLR